MKNEKWNQKVPRLIAECKRITFGHIRISSTRNALVLSTVEACGFMALLAARGASLPFVARTMS
jgi:hypothetical protein